MTSSRFSRRPRVQPTPKICHVPPLPPPPPWPNPTMIAAIDWDCTDVPPPPWSVHESAYMLWYPDHNWYHGFTPGEGDHVEAWFTLDLVTGAYSTRLWAWRGPAGLFGSPTITGSVTPGKPIDLTFDPWPGLPPSHDLSAHFTA